MPIDEDRVTRTVGALILILGEDLSADMSQDTVLEALNALGVVAAFVVHCAEDPIEALTFFNEVVSRNLYDQSVGRRQNLTKKVDL